MTSPPPLQFPNLRLIDIEAYAFFNDGEGYALNNCCLTGLRWYDRCRDPRHMDHLASIAGSGR